MLLKVPLIVACGYITANTLNTKTSSYDKLSDHRQIQFRCSSEIYCHGEMLAVIQRANIFADCKKFVDMVGKYDEGTILKRFKRLGPDPSRSDILRFVTQNFFRPGHELKIVIPEDWKEDPEFLNGIKDQNYRAFALEVHKKWKALVRWVDPSKTCQNCATSMLPLPFPFVVPGGRFRELYYWDSYWIMEGLYVSGMCGTAQHMLKNYEWMIKEYGYIPNGSRIYYLNRSHPPMFTLMVERFMDNCVNVENRTKFLAESLPFMDQEYLFWKDRRSVAIKDDSGKVLHLNRYDANTTIPRPESYLQDTLLANDAGLANASKMFKDIASAAESGWDFSSRWFVNGTTNFTSIATSDIIPVDLNSLLYRVEIILAELNDIAGEPLKGEDYRKSSLIRLEAIETILWKESNATWRDFNLSGQPQERTLYVSDLSPLWFSSFNSSKTDVNVIETILSSYSSILEQYPGGIPIDNVVSGQQWDLPNIWAPIQHHFILLYLRLSLQCDPSKKLFWESKALDLAKKFLENAYCGYRNYGQLFEKYHAQFVGQPGGGGEYTVQDGFGWTNGVVLWILKHYGADLKPPTSCPPIYNPQIMVNEDYDAVDFDLLKKYRLAEIMDILFTHYWASMLALIAFFVILFWTLRRFSRFVERSNETHKLVYSMGNDESFYSIP